jgi:hypothetical protein
MKDFERMLDEARGKSNIGIKGPLIITGPQE